MNPEDETQYDDLDEQVKKPEDLYYYAGRIRILFFMDAILMLILSPFFKENIVLSIMFVVFGIVLIVLAGITNRKLKVVFFLNAIISLFIMIVLELIALNESLTVHPFLIFFSQLLSIVMVIALYFCLRTIRGFLFK